MRILTLTTYEGYNYGASLQAYALQHFLKLQGHDTAIIRFEPEYLMRYYAFWYVNPDSRLNANPITRMLYRIMKWGQRRTTLKRKRVFDYFNHQILTETEQKWSSSEMLMHDPPKADLYLCGSDQIWNVLYEAGRDPVFYLEFVKEGKKASYAASFSFLDLPKEHFVRIQRSLQKFDAVSVRELQGKELVEKMGVDAAWVLDPVFLISVSEWDSLINRKEILSYEPCDIKEKYLLIYDFEGNAKLKEFAINYSRRHNLKIFAITDRFPLCYADKNFKNAGPVDFIRMIKGCDCFISNSFHGTAFSIIFHKPFFVFNREKAKVNSRMQSLLQLFGLEDRIVVDENEKSYSIDWEKIDKIRGIKHMESINFLKQLGV